MVGSNLRLGGSMAEHQEYLSTVKALLNAKYSHSDSKGNHCLRIGGARAP